MQWIHGFKEEFMNGLRKFKGFTKCLKCVLPAVLRVLLNKQLSTFWHFDFK